MDIFAHALWTNVVFYKKYRERRKRYLSVLFGVLPDLISFAPVFIYAQLFGTDFFDLIDRNIWVVKWASFSYNFTHSLVIFTLVFMVVGILRLLKFKKFLYWPMLGWLLHIFIDIWSHKGFYETPFLYPLSNYRFQYGTSWGNPKFMIINYSLMAVVYLVWLLILRKREQSMIQSRNI